MKYRPDFPRKKNFKGELNPKIDLSSFEHLGIVEQLYEVFFMLLAKRFKKVWCFLTNRQDLIGGLRYKLRMIQIN